MFMPLLIAAQRSDSPTILVPSASMRPSTIAPRSVPWRPQASGAAVPDKVAAGLKPPATSQDLGALATSTRPMWLAAVGSIGLAFIIWLMIAKPF
jgi:hypothetical protein